MDTEMMDIGSIPQYDSFNNYIIGSFYRINIAKHQIRIDMKSESEISVISSYGPNPGISFYRESEHVLLTKWVCWVLLSKPRIFNFLGKKKSDVILIIDQNCFYFINNCKFEMLNYEDIVEINFNTGNNDKIELKLLNSVYEIEIISTTSNNH